MMNLHKFYYKDYFSLQDVPIENVSRHLDFELLFDDTKKNQLEGEIRALEGRKRNVQERQKQELEAQIAELKALMSVNVNVVNYRNKLLTASNYSKKDQYGKPTRELLEEVGITNEVSPDNLENRLSLNVSYPGLVTGVGIDHEAKFTGEFKLGVHFDWTHGMPVVYGSSVKGMLRSWFVDIYKTSKEKYYECGIDAIDLMICVFSGLYDRDIEAEQKKYKENWEIKIADPSNRIYKYCLSIYERDIFFDAVITHTDAKGRILCSDSITPHGDNPLKNPVPITFLKIAPGCTMEFRFKLHDTKIGDKTFSASDKIELFKEILTTVGIGAKTNVGYGQLKSTD